MFTLFYSKKTYLDLTRFCRASHTQEKKTKKDEVEKGSGNKCQTWHTFHPYLDEAVISQLFETHAYQRGGGRACHPTIPKIVAHIRNLISNVSSLI